MEENYEIFQKNSDYIDIVELRIDFLNLDNPIQLEKAKNFPSKISKPVVLTCRRKSDGGNFNGTETDRLKVLQQVSEGNFAYVDIEYDVKNCTFETILRNNGTKIIRSAHFWDSSSENIDSFVESVCSDFSVCKNNYIPKLAVKINSVNDLIRFFKLSERMKNIPEKILVGMGIFGVPTRILYKKTGSMLMYCLGRDYDSSIPDSGLLSAKLMKQIYCADKVTENSKIFGVIGNPVIHSKSPIIHNNGYRKINLDAIYVPFTVDNLEDFFKFASLCKISGFSVTAPFKRDVIPFLENTSNNVKLTKSCNTVVYNNKKWVGYNTDCEAVISLFGNEINNGTIKKALIIGSGGVASALASVLCEQNIKVTILSRSFNNKEKFANLSNCYYDLLCNISKYSESCDLIFQATPCTEDISKGLEYSGNEYVCDLVYNPPETEFLIRAKRCGCKTVSGLDFLYAQAIKQFELFTEQA